MYCTDCSNPIERCSCSAFGGHSNYGGASPASTSPALSAQPVASKELSDEQIDAIAHEQDEPGEPAWFTAQITKLEWRQFARDILAASRLDGANAGEKP